MEVDFTGRHVLSDGGVLLLREMDGHLVLYDRLARCYSDSRHPDMVEPGLPAMIRQRVLEIALGYEELA